MQVKINEDTISDLNRFEDVLYIVVLVFVQRNFLLIIVRRSKAIAACQVIHGIENIRFMGHFYTNQNAFYIF